MRRRPLDVHRRRLLDALALLGQRRLARAWPRPRRSPGPRPPRAAARPRATNPRRSAPTPLGHREPGEVEEQRQPMRNRHQADARVAPVKPSPACASRGDRAADDATRRPRQRYRQGRYSRSASSPVAPAISSRKPITVRPGRQVVRKGSTPTAARCRRRNPRATVTSRPSDKQIGRQAEAPASQRRRARPRAAAEVGDRPAATACVKPGSSRLKVSRAAINASRQQAPEDPACFGQQRRASRGLSDADGGLRARTQRTVTAVPAARGIPGSGGHIGADYRRAPSPPLCQPAFTARSRAADSSPSRRFRDRGAPFRRPVIARGHGARGESGHGIRRPGPSESSHARPRRRPARRSSRDHEPAQRRRGVLLLPRGRRRQVADGPADGIARQLGDGDGALPAADPDQRPAAAGDDRARRRHRRPRRASAPGIRWPGRAAVDCWPPQSHCRSGSGWPGSPLASIPPYYFVQMFTWTFLGSLAYGCSTLSREESRSSACWSTPSARSSLQRADAARRSCRRCRRRSSRTSCSIRWPMSSGFTRRRRAAAAKCCRA